MEQDLNGKWKMKRVEDLMDDDVKNTPSNVLHMFQISTWDFGLDNQLLSGRRINFVCAIKQKNAGKIDSHRWFFQGICRYLKPDQCLLLDVGTRPEEKTIYRMYKYMVKSKRCGGCQGELEIDLSESSNIPSYLLQVSQFYEHKL